MLEAVLFDLDGTLVDTAPDLGAAANRLRQELNLPPVPLERLRPYTSQGVRGLLRAGLSVEADDPRYAALADRFLQFYAENLCVGTRLFDGMAEFLARLETHGIPWGVVTNKRERFTRPLMEALGLAARTPCIVSGDTTSAAKPSPLPVLHACALLAATPANTLFIGDDPRDIAAGRAAGTWTAAVSYGYLGDNPPITEWQAHFVAHQPADLLACLTEGWPAG